MKQKKSLKRDKTYRGFCVTIDRPIDNRYYSEHCPCDHRMLHRRASTYPTERKLTYRQTVQKFFVSVKFSLTFSNFLKDSSILFIS